jgi:hypothetical protein
LDAKLLPLLKTAHKNKNPVLITLMEDDNKFKCPIVKIDEINNAVICFTRKGIEAVNVKNKLDDPDNTFSVPFDKIKDIKEVIKDGHL